MRDATDLLSVIASDLEATRRALIRLVSRADALDALLARAIELADRQDHPPTLAELQADAKAKGAVELARYQGLLATVEATGDR